MLLAVKYETPAPRGVKNTNTQQSEDISRSTPEHTLPWGAVDALSPIGMHTDG